MKHNVKQMIDKAIAVIANQYDFFAPAACAMPWVEDYSVPTACTNGLRVRYNPDFVASLAPPAVVGLIIHEVCHPLFGHLDRSKHMTDDHMANIAFDYEINNLIEKYNETASRKIVLPPEGYVDLAKYKNEAGEVIYRKLQEEEQQKQDEQKQDEQKQDGDGDGDGDPQDGDGDPQDGDGNPQDGDGNGKDDKPQDGNGKDGKPQDGDGKDGKPQDGKGKADKPSSSGMFEKCPEPKQAEEVATRWREILSSTIQTSRLRGNVSGDFLQKFSELLDPPVTMRDLLEKYVCDFALADDSTKSDRRWLANHDMCVAGIESERHGTIVFVKDTSGSITDTILKTACSVIQDACNTLNASRIIVLDVDAAVCDVNEYLPNEEIPATCKGRGGTDFRPAFKWVEENAPDARVLIYLTDGWGMFPSETPDIPTLWLSWDLEESGYPFGQVVALDVLNNAAA
jgi:hypothetical protein